MTVGVLLITHENIGRVMLDTATVTLGECPLSVESIDVQRDCNPAQVLKKARGAVNSLDEGNGVLVLTDLYGATPSNICSQLLEDLNVSVVAGLNLSMLIRVLNYPEKDLHELSDKAIDGGKTGILQITGRF